MILRATFAIFTLLILSGCDSSPSKPAEVVNHSNTFYGKDRINKGRSNQSYNSNKQPEYIATGNIAEEFNTTPDKPVSVSTRELPKPSPSAHITSSRDDVVNNSPISIKENQNQKKSIPFESAPPPDSKDGVSLEGKSGLEDFIKGLEEDKKVDSKASLSTKEPSKISDLPKTTDVNNSNVIDKPKNLGTVSISEERKAEGAKVDSVTSNGKNVESSPSTTIATVATPSNNSANESNKDFIWPVKGKVISKFGDDRMGAKNDGITLAVPENTPVKSISSGTVAYVGSDLSDYGNMVIIRHDNGYISAYSHNKSVNVKKGDKVQQGDVIARSGSTGKVKDPQLHFSIRQGREPVNPIGLIN